MCFIDAKTDCLFYRNLGNKTNQFNDKTCFIDTKTLPSDDKTSKYQ